MELHLQTTTSTTDADARSHAWAEPRRIAVVVAYVGLGAALLWSRLANLGHSFWNDEILMVEGYVRAGPRHILSGPDLNHELMALFSWVTTSVVGESEIALRLLSAVPFVAAVVVVAVWLHRRQGVLSAMLFVFLTLSGGLDLWRAAADKIVLAVIPPEADAFARDIREKTPPRAMILHAPAYNSEVYLTGRRTLYGYPGHIWSQGLDAGTREEDIKKMYTGHPDADALLKKYGVDFAVVGPHERAIEGFDDRALRRIEEVAERGPYHLYRVR